MPHRDRFDSGVDGAEPFIVLELVTGRTLRQVLDEAGPLAAGQAVAIAAGVCEALAVAHAAGLVHRDIKPANIALAADGQVKVLDQHQSHDDITTTAARTLRRAPALAIHASLWPTGALEWESAPDLER